MAEFTLLYDGGCPLCRREVTFLAQRDQARHGEQPRLAFVDIDQADYDPEAHQGVSYAEAMGRIHGIEANGAIVRDLAVFRRAYEEIGLGWLYAPTRWPVVGGLADWAYGLWARLRLRLTGRPGLEQLCAVREAGCGCGTTPARESSASWAGSGGSEARADRAERESSALRGDSCGPEAGADPALMDG